jgi:hypothetical protein
VTSVFDVDKRFGARVELVEFFAISLGDDSIVVTMNNEKGEFDVGDAFDVWELISWK